VLQLTFAFDWALPGLRDLVGAEKTPALSPTMQCVLNLAFHEAQLDYYGKRAAAACGAPVQPDDSKGLPEGDYTVYVWDITDNQQQLIGQLKGHDGSGPAPAATHPAAKL